MHQKVIGVRLIKYIQYTPYERASPIKSTLNQVRPVRFVEFPCRPLFLLKGGSHMRLFTTTSQNLNGVNNTKTPVGVQLAAASPWDKFPSSIMELAEYGVKGSRVWPAFQRIGVPAYAVAFAIVFSLRASEVLALTLGNVLPNGSIVVQSKKHGRAHTMF